MHIALLCRDTSSCVSQNSYQFSDISVKFLGLSFTALLHHAELTLREHSLSVPFSYVYIYIYMLFVGRAIAETVIRRLPIAAARVRAQVGHCGICSGQSGAGSGFLRVLRFPLPFLIPLTAPHSSPSVIRGWYSRPITLRSTKWTQPHPAP
jgi:hypothetical protein